MRSPWAVIVAMLAIWAACLMATTAVASEPAPLRELTDEERYDVAAGAAIIVRVRILDAEYGWITAERTATIKGDVPDQLLVEDVDVNRPKDLIGKAAILFIHRSGGRYFPVKRSPLPGVLRIDASTRDSVEGRLKRAIENRSLQSLARNADAIVFSRIMYRPTPRYWLFGVSSVAGDPLPAVLSIDSGVRLGGGSEYLLFLRRMPDGGYGLLHGDAGAMVIENGPHGRLVGAYRDGRREPYEQIPLDSALRQIRIVRWLSLNRSTPRPHRTRSS